jgi:PAS domain-containing protein
MDPSDGFDNPTGARTPTPRSSRPYSLYRLLYRKLDVIVAVLHILLFPYKTVLIIIIIIIIREEHRVRVFESRVLRRIFGWKRDEMVGGRRRLRN